MYLSSVTFETPVMASNADAHSSAVAMCRYGVWHAAPTAAHAYKANGLVGRSTSGVRIVASVVAGFDSGSVIAFVDNSVVGTVFGSVVFATVAGVVFVSVTVIATVAVPVTNAGILSMTFSPMPRDAW